MPLSTTQQTIRDIAIGSEYWIITDPVTGGRCFYVGNSIAAWQTRKAAKDAATRLHEAGALASGYRIVRQIKD